MSKPKKATWEEFFLHALAYMVDHPGRKWSCHVDQDQAKAKYGYAVVRGTDLLASGKKGDILAFAKKMQTQRKSFRLRWFVWMDIKLSPASGMTSISRNGRRKRREKERTVVYAAVEGNACYVGSGP